MKLPSWTRNPTEEGSSGEPFAGALDSKEARKIVLRKQRSGENQQAIEPVEDLVAVENANVRSYVFAVDNMRVMLIHLHCSVRNGWKKRLPVENGA